MELFDRKDNLNKSLVLGYIDPMVGLIAECFVSHLEPCEKPGLKAEVWKSFAEVTGFMLIFKKFTDIGFSSVPDRPPNATYVLEALENGTINASLALSTMQVRRFQAFRYSMPVYFSQNGLVAGKGVYGPPTPIAVQVFDWSSILLLAIFVLAVGVARRNIWNSFAEFVNKQKRMRTLSDSVLVLFGAFVLIQFNAGFRGEAGMIRKLTRITGKELIDGLNRGTFRINTRDYVSAENANRLNLLGRKIDQAEIDSLVTYEKDYETVARQLCEDERMIRFEWVGGVNTLVGGRWKSSDCGLEKLEISDSSDLTPRIPSGFALHRDFPRVYRDLLNQIIITQFYGNQLERTMRRYDASPWTNGKKKAQLFPETLSLHLLSNGFILFTFASCVCAVVFVVELLTQKTTVLDPGNVQQIPRICWRFCLPITFLPFCPIETELHNKVQFIAVQFSSLCTNFSSPRKSKMGIVDNILALSGASVETILLDQKGLLTAPGIPRPSPIQVLTRPNVA